MTCCAVIVASGIVPCESCTLAAVIHRRSWPTREAVELATLKPWTVHGVITSSPITVTNDRMGRRTKPMDFRKT